MHKPLFGPGNIEGSSYGTVNGLPVLDSVDLIIDKVKEGLFFGRAALTLRTQEAKEAYKISERSFLVIEGVHASNWFSQVPNWVDLDKKKKGLS